ncbi:unnamed protein product [Clonostachys byssicola]|uniref:Uncharacterized protein n=1 Tax=Clonostachys byssicola TaxID=160290 RepID=A0A9N9UDS6_9HYPO|nr:unnamed protein product [Clonostachys byssicola]
MVAIEQIRNELAQASPSGRQLVAVFVGGTSGIGESTARELVRYSTSPRIYLIGRSQDQADRIKTEFASLNPASDVCFVQSDASQLRNVDNLCDKIKAQEERLDVLFLSAGIFHLRGREETPDGLDRKMALDFYSRLRFTENLLPLLRRASSLSSSQSTRELLPAGGRVISVLGGGKETSIDESDLSLTRKYTLKASTDNAVTMTTLSFQRLAAEPENANVAFFHTSPGMVKTNGDRELNFVIRLLVSTVSYVFRPWVTSTEETGKRHLWAAVSDSFRGGQVYLLDRTSERAENSKVLNRLHEEGLSDRVWEHTREVFSRIPTGDNHNV